MSKIKKFPTNLFKKADATALEVDADMTPDDLSNFSEPYRLELAGDPEGAARAWSKRGAQYEAAMALGFGSSAQKLRAMEMFRNMDALPAQQRLAALTGQPGRKRGRPRSSGPHGLTSRQIDVLRLLGEGKTNGEIGKTLFISPKTVDHHVSAILARLEAKSRGEAAAIARKLDLI